MFTKTFLQLLAASCSFLPLLATPRGPGKKPLQHQEVAKTCKKPLEAANEFLLDVFGKAASCAARSPCTRSFLQLLTAFCSSSHPFATPCNSLQLFLRTFPFFHCRRYAAPAAAAQPGGARRMRGDVVRGCRYFVSVLPFPSFCFLLVSFSACLLLLALALRCCFCSLSQSQHSRRCVMIATAFGRAKGALTIVSFKSVLPLFRCKSLHLFAASCNFLQLFATSCNTKR